MDFKAGSFQVCAWVIIFLLLMTVLARFKILCLATGLYYQAQAPHLCTTTEMTSNPAWCWKFNTPHIQIQGAYIYCLQFPPFCNPVKQFHVGTEVTPLPIHILFALFIPLSVMFPKNHLPTMTLQRLTSSHIHLTNAHIPATLQLVLSKAGKQFLKLW